MKASNWLSGISSTVPTCSNRFRIRVFHLREKIRSNVKAVSPRADAANWAGHGSCPSQWWTQIRSQFGHWNAGCQADCIGRSGFFKLSFSISFNEVGALNLAALR